MSPADYQRRKAAFSAAMDVPEERRNALIDELCAGDAAMSDEVKRLVRNAGLENSFLDSGALPGREWVAGQVLCDRFELLRLAGEGGMGQVWAALDRRLGETVAIKTIQAGLAADAVVRLQRELLITRPIGHPNVCRVYELFEDSSSLPPRVFLTMQFLEGETLAARLRREGRLVPAEALRLFAQIAEGLAAAHAAGVVHRDLKPSNVMLTPDAATGQEKAVVMDFGLARAYQPTAESDLPATRTGQVMGTFEYMSPEQIRGEAATPAADVYALGLLLFEMLDGQAPFHGKNTMDTWMRRIREGPPRLAAGQRIPDLEPRVDDVIARCLEYDEAARFASPLDAVAALRARPARPSVTLPKEWRRWAAALAACASLALAALWLVPRLRLQTVPDDVRRAYDEAQRDLSEGAAARAGAELRRAIERAPTFAAAHAALAETQLELDQVFQARESIQRAAYLAPDRSKLPEAEALHIEGVNLLILRDCAKAVETLRRRAELVDAPFRATALASLARAYERCELTGEARKTLDVAAAADPRNAAVRVRAAFLASRRADQETASRLLSQAEVLYRERANFEGVAEVLATRGTLAAERDQLDEASKALQEAMSLAETTKSVPQQVRVLWQQAIVARKRGALADAERLTAQGVELARRNDLETLAMQGLFTAANVDFIKNEFARAEAGYQQALEIATRYRDEGNQARAWLSLASLNVRSGQPGKAAEFLAKARPIYLRTANERILGQIDALEVSVGLSGADFARVLEIQKRRLQKAREKRDAAGMNEALRGLRLTYMEMGRWLDAAEASRQIDKEASPVPVRGRDLLADAEILAHLGRIGEARNAIQQAAKSAPAAPAFAVRLEFVRAVTSVIEGKSAEAERELRALLQRPELDAGTRMYARLWNCTLLSWGPQPGRAEETCRALEADARAAGRVLLPLLVRLRIAEARLREGARAEAAELAGKVEQEAASWGPESEWRWRAEAIAAAAGGRKPLALLAGVGAGGRPDLARLTGVPAQ